MLGDTISSLKCLKELLRNSWKNFRKFPKTSLVKFQRNFLQISVGISEQFMVEFLVHSWKNFRFFKEFMDTPEGACRTFLMKFIRNSSWNIREFFSGIPQKLLQNFSRKSTKNFIEISQKKKNQKFLKEFHLIFFKNSYTNY